MKCIECGSRMETRNEQYVYDQGGLRVILHNLPVHHCTSCDEVEVEIPRIEQLNQVLATAILRKPERLSGAEIRFLRKSLGWSGKDFAAHAWVEPETVSRWEGDKQPISQTADRFLRLAVSVGAPIEDYSLEDLRNASGNKPLAEPMHFERGSSKAWQQMVA